MGLFGKKNEKKVSKEVKKITKSSQESVSLDSGITYIREFDDIKHAVSEIFSDVSYDEKMIFSKTITDAISVAQRHRVRNQSKCEDTINLIKDFINKILEKVVQTKNKLLINDQVSFLVYLIKSYQTEDCKYLYSYTDLLKNYENKIKITEVLCKKCTELGELNNAIVRLIKACDLPTTTEEEKNEILNQISYLESVNKVEIEKEIQSIKDVLLSLDEEEKEKTGLINGKVIIDNSRRYDEYEKTFTKRAEQQEEMAYEMEKKAELIAKHKTEILNNTMSPKMDIRNAVRQGVEASNAGIENRRDKDDALINSVSKEDLAAKVARLKKKYEID